MSKIKPNYIKLQLTNFDHFVPLDAVSASEYDGESDSCPHNAVRGGHGQFGYGGHEQPDTAT